MKNYLSNNRREPKLPLKSKKAVKIITVLLLGSLTLSFSACEDKQKEKEDNTPEIPENKENTNSLLKREAKAEANNNNAFGIDISHHNESLNINKLVKWNIGKLTDKREDTKPIEYIYIRSGYGTETNDKKLKHNYTQIQNYNDTCNEDMKIKIGFYFFYVPGQNPKTQAKHFIKEIKKLGINNHENLLIPMLDVEKKGKKSSKELQKDILIWLKTVEKELGVKPGIYSGVVFYENYLDSPELNKYPKRFAAYNRGDRIKGDDIKGINKTYKDANMFQWSEKVKIPGAGNSQGFTDANDTYQYNSLFWEQEKKREEGDRDNDKPQKDEKEKKNNEIISFEPKDGFKFETISRHKTHYIFSYKLQSKNGGTPNAVVNKIIRLYPEFKNQKSTIKVTNSTGKHYKAGQNIKKDVEVFIRVAIK